MKTTIKFIILLIAVALLGTACNNESIISPAYFTAEQDGNTVVLTWTPVANATMYEISRNGVGWQTTSFTSIVDNNPKEGNNRYELYAIIKNKSYSAAIASLYFESNTTGGTNGGDNENRTENSLPITKENLIGYWQGTYRTFYDGDKDDYSDYFWNFSNDGICERIIIEGNSSGWSVQWGTWRLTSWDNVVHFEANHVKSFNSNGHCWYSNEEDLEILSWGIEEITTTTMKYKEGKYPYISTLEYKRIPFIPSPYNKNLFR